jgi:hypothetical protein
MPSDVAETAAAPAPRRGAESLKESGSMEMEQLLNYRVLLLARFERLPVDFAQTIAAIPEAEWWLRRISGGHTIHAVMAHVRDLETLAFLPRLRRILAEEGPALHSFGHHRWRDGEYDPTEPMEGLLADYAHAREEELALVRDLTPEGWSRRGFHPPSGWRTVQWWVERALTHGLEHLAEICMARVM